MPNRLTRRAPSARRARPQWSRRPSGAARWVSASGLEIAIPVLVYVALVLFGATWSSLGAPPMREDPAAGSDHAWGAPQAVRSDEWLTQTSAELGTLARGHAVHSPLAEQPDIVFQLSSGGWAESVLFAENNILRLGPWLPDTVLFAAARWLPVLILALTLPPLLGRLGANRPLSWLAFALVSLAPTSAWWSFTPVRIAANGSLSAFLLVTAFERLRAPRGRLDAVVAFGLAAAGGIAAARVGTYYVPWGITVAIPIIATGAIWMLAQDVRRALLVLMAGVVCGGVVLCLAFVENWDTVTATLNTVYPGSRQSTGDAFPVEQLFGAPGLGTMQWGAVPTALNQPEVSSAYLLCGVWAIALLPRLRARTRAASAAIAAIGLATALELAWCTIYFGPLGSHIPLVSLVPPGRAAQTVGYSASILLVLVLSQVDRATVRTRYSLGVGALTGFVTAYGVSALRHFLPNLTTGQVALISLVVAITVVLVTRFPETPAAILVAIVALAAPVYSVNPLTFGLGQWRTSHAADAARALADDAERNHVWVAADSIYVSSLLIANGVPTLSGYQTSGPDEATWRLLDPSETYEQQWNRGASYLWTSFDTRGDVSVDNPNTDIVRLTFDPCTVSPELRLGYIVSAARSDASCLSHAGSFEWNGAVQNIYRITTAGH